MADQTLEDLGIDIGDGQRAAEAASPDQLPMPERVLLWIPNNGGDKLLHDMRQQAGTKWPGMTCEIVNPKYFDDADMMIDQVLGCAVPSFYSHVAASYRKLGIECMVIDWKPSQPKASPEMSPEQEDEATRLREEFFEDMEEDPEHVPPPIEPTPESGEHIDQETVQATMELSVRGMTEVIEVIDHPGFVRAVLDLEQAKSKPRTSAVRMLQARLNDLKG